MRARGFRFITRALAAASALPLAAAAATAAAPPPPPPPPPPAHVEDIVDPSTGLSFPSHARGLALVGTGTRIKYGFVKVYSVGLYVDGARAAAGARGGAAALAAVADGALGAELVIKLCRDVGAKELGAALQDSIAPRVRARAARDGAEPAADLAALAALGPALSAAAGALLPAGTEVSFRWVRADDTLAVTVNGAPAAAPARVPALCGGFFETYVGAEPLIPAARAAWIAGIEARA
jgi:hypothetical protein